MANLEELIKKAVPIIRNFIDIHKLLHLTTSGN